MKNLTKMNLFSLKSLKNKTIVCLVLIQSSLTLAYVPEIPFILKKTSGTTGRKIVQIEQEVTFKVGEEEAKVDEIWLIEGDKNLKLTAVGKNLYKDNIKLNYLYNGKNKTFLIGKNKNISPVNIDFFQRYLFIRSQNSFMSYLKELNIPAHDKSNVKLSRADGVISFLIGQPSEQNLNPQVWIGQDDFVVRKIRTPSAAEITLSQIASLPKDIYIAKAQTITWQTTQPVTVQIRIKKIDVDAGGSITAFYPQNLDTPSEMTFSNKTPLTAVIEEFYSRFR
ncbi:MAG: hypothetical protein H7235_02440 [Bdellovibrionaceae bacterium]|nr:hypothetical protein [Pseudobdellovibrionaceae bacterium]